MRPCLELISEPPELRTKYAEHKAIKAWNKLVVLNQKLASMFFVIADGWETRILKAYAEGEVDPLIDSLAGRDMCCLLNQADVLPKGIKIKD